MTGGEMEGINFTNWGPYVFSLVLVVVALVVVRWQMLRNIDRTIALDVPTAARQVQRIAELQSRIDALVVENAKAKSRAEAEFIGRLEVQAKQYNDKLSVLTAELKEARSDIASMRQEMAVLKAGADRVPELLTKIEQLEEKVRCLEEENESLRSLVAELNVQLNVVLDENKSLRLENGELKKAVEKARKGF